VLEEFTLPLRFAQRDFAERRAELKGLAQTMRRAVGNAAELEAAAEGADRRREWVVRRDVPIPVSRFLFDPVHVGAASEPIEVPQGFVLAGSFDLEEARLVIEDRCDALQVAFSHFDANTWATWFRDLQQRLKGKTTYVHPDYRDAMPLWLDLP